MMRGMPPDPTLGERAWFACEHPERDTDPFVVWHYNDCAGCQMRVLGLLILDDDDPHVRWLNEVVGG